MFPYFKINGAGVPKIKRGVLPQVGSSMGTSLQDFAGDAQDSVTFVLVAMVILL